MKYKNPNIVLIVLDSVRPDHFSCYGYDRPTTPNADRIARDGIIFTRAYSASCWTMPSHASIFTGLYPSQHQANGDIWSLHSGHETIASFLGRSGYQTASISCNAYISDYTNLSNGFDICIDVKQSWKGREEFLPRLLHSLSRRWREWTWKDHGAHRATRFAVNWLRKRDQSQPFFLFLNYMDCHLPYRLRLPERYKFINAVDRKRIDNVLQDPYAYMAGKISFSFQDMADIQALYDGSLFYLDQHVGMIYDQLEKLGLAENTVFIITSDHGESFGEHGLMDHQYGLYEQLIHVPFIMRLPGRYWAGERSRKLIQHVDIFPTIINLLFGGSGTYTIPSRLPGTSILEDPAREVVMAEYLVPNLRTFQRRFPEIDVQKFDMAIRAISNGKYKLILWNGGRTELYDLEKDQWETHNIANDLNPVLVELETRLEYELGPWLVSPNSGETKLGMSEEMRERLKELGYL